MQRGAVVIGYQYIQSQGRFPVFNAVTELMGYLGIQQVINSFEMQGKVLGELGGVCGSHVVILGGGACGIRAALLAAGAGAGVTIMDASGEILRKAALRLPTQISTLHYTAQNLEEVLPTADVLIGAALPVAGAAPVLVTSEQMKLLQRGTFAVDLATDFGGNFEVSKARPFQDPITQMKGVTHYTGHRITNLAPFAFATAVGSAVLPWALQVANKGWKRAVFECDGLQEGICIAEGRLTSRLLARATQLANTPVEKVLESEIRRLSSQKQANLANIMEHLDSLRIQQRVHTGGTIAA